MSDTTSTTSDRRLSDTDLDRIDAFWRAANYLSVGQIYLLDNPLLRRPLSRDDIKPRLLGHWGTTPGLNFVYAHLNRAIRERDLDTLFVAGPGHGGPGVVASAYLDGTYSELYSAIDRSEDGLRRLFRQFSFPGGIPSHAAPQTPGSIHEGGELGYALSHAYGAAFDNPDHVAIVVHNYRWRLGLAEGESRFDEIEARIGAAPRITLPAITLEGDANGAPHPAPSAYRSKFAGRYEHRDLSGGIGHNLPQEAPKAFAQAVLDVVRL